MKHDDTDKQSDAQLVLLALKGERRAFERLMLRYGLVVEEYIRQLVEDYEDAQDLTQETFLNAFRHLDALREPDRFATWLKSIAWRECRGWMRRQRVARMAAHHLGSEIENASPSEMIGPYAAEEGEAAPDEWLDRLEETFEDMGRKRCLILALFYVKGLRLEEIARFLDVPLGTVKHRLFKARQVLAENSQEIPSHDGEGRRRFVEAVMSILSESITGLSTLGKKENVK